MIPKIKESSLKGSQIKMSARDNFVGKMILNPGNCMNYQQTQNLLNSTEGVAFFFFDFTQKHANDKLQSKTVRLVNQSRMIGQNRKKIFTFFF